MSVRIELKWIDYELIYNYFIKICVLLGKETDKPNADYPSLKSSRSEVIGDAKPPGSSELPDH
jgi:hypothetical protein